MSNSNVIEAFEAMSTCKALRALADELEEEGRLHECVVVIIDGDYTDVRGFGTKCNREVANLLIDLGKQTLLGSDGYEI